MNVFVDKIIITKDYITINKTATKLTIFEWLNTTVHQNELNALCNYKKCIIVIDPDYESFVEPIVNIVTLNNKVVQRIMLFNHKVVYKNVHRKKIELTQFVAIVIALGSLGLMTYKIKLDKLYDHTLQQLSNIRYIKKDMLNKNKVIADAGQQLITQFAANNMFIESMIFLFPNQIKITYFSKKNNLQLGMGYSLIESKKLGNLPTGGYHEVTIKIK